MPFGRYTCGVQCHIVLAGVPDPLGEGEIGVEREAKPANRKLRDQELSK